MTEITASTLPLPVAQIHALLYTCEEPLMADEIAAALTIARSNVANSIEELLAWRLINRAGVGKGDSQ